LSLSTGPWSRVPPESVNPESNQPPMRASERKAKLRPHPRQVVSETVADAKSGIVKDPQLGWRSGANVDPELKLIGYLEWTFTRQRKLGRREEVVVNEGDPDVRQKTLHIKTERVPNFQAVLQRPVVRISGPADRSISRCREPGADAQQEVLHMEFEEVADPGRVEEDKIFFDLNLPAWRAFDGRGSVKCLAKTRCEIRFDRPPLPYWDLELRLGQCKDKILRRGDLGSEYAGLEGEVSVAQVGGERQSPRILIRPQRKGMLQRNPEDIDRKPADIVGPESELHRIGKIDLDIELSAIRLSRCILRESGNGA